MSKSQRLKNVLDRAKGKEKKYDWLGAAELHAQALRTVEKTDFLRKGEIQEKIGRCFHRAAFQAETREEFKSRMVMSVGAYEKAAGLFERLEDSGDQAQISSCRAMASYSKSWLVDNLSERKAVLDECWKLHKEALKIYDKAGDHLGLGKTCVELTNCLVDRLDLELDTRTREEILEEALSLGERAIQIFSKARDEHELARAYCITGIHCENAAMSLRLETRRGECEQKAFDYAREAIRISESTDDKFVLGRSTVLLGFAENDLGAGPEVSCELFRKALQYCTMTKDHLLVSEAFDGLAFSTSWNMRAEEDLEKIREMSRKCEEYVNGAISCSTLADYGLGIPHSYGWGYTANFTELARREIKLETKHKLLKKAVAFGKQGLEHAQRTGSTHATLHTSSSLVHALYYLAIMETGTEKKQLLEEAMSVGEKAVYYVERLRPLFKLPVAFPYEALALIMFELSKLEDGSEKRKELLEKSVSRMETCIAFLRRHVTSFPSRRELLAMLGGFYTELGSILNQLYQATTEEEVLRRIIETHQSAVQMNEKADLVSRVSEAYWQIAIAHDRFGEYPESASNFKLASDNYTLAAKKTPPLKDFYQDHASYMKAWNEIERAKHCHTKRQYGQAKEHYDKASNLHESTIRWNYLSPNYSAWARLEEAEDLSRREQTQEAKALFQQASELFAEAKKSIQVNLDEIESKDEKDLLGNLAKASDIRREYCLGRVALEEARILDRKGDHVASSGKYGSAIEKFQKAADAMKLKSDRQELNPIVSLCKAWQMMTRAEAEASPDLYLEASKLFEEAKEHSYDEKAKILALGHSSFCKALEAGTRFEATRDLKLYSTAKKHLEAAANYYIRAGFKSASEYARATHRLFDAYMYVHKAESETEPRKKTQFYQMAERLLQSSAGSFMKAKHPAKSQEVQRLLESVKEERQLAMSLTEVLHAPTITSATTSFSTPTPTHEKAVGLERFEHADIQANLILRVTEVKVGEDVSLAIELVNAGKAPALLIKVDEIIPEGFEIKQVPEMYTFEDSYVNMKGKRLNPLKTEDVKMVVSPRSKGTFIVKPRILYIDEAGKYRSHEPEPVTITVRELGIKGWIKGER